ncbi:uncharacterized protein IL334_004101 [Kwoniella shivajii]|uniref:Uncharacterized protein n=1 Tax=Kwoniella shivajii TaxID=564305 RepID=A0ABZ1CZE0_9TREE|nr:hypothetical protein IL334_004101 [Kwoniella shivajii]
MHHFDFSGLTELFCQCISSFSPLKQWSCFSPNTPPSPEVEAHEGELQTLLQASTNKGWDDQDDFSLSPSTLAGRSIRQAREFGRPKPMIKYHQEEPSFDTHLSTSDLYKQTSVCSEHDEDPRSLSFNPMELAELAKQFEPTLTMEDIRKEEEEQAELERKAETVDHEIRKEDIDHIGIQDEFGEFEHGTDVEGNKMEEISFGIEGVQDHEEVQ